jgi:hypothetical protein
MDLQWPENFTCSDNMMRRERPQTTVSINAGTMTRMA